MLITLDRRLVHIINTNNLDHKYSLVKRYGGMRIFLLPQKNSTKNIHNLLHSENFFTTPKNSTRDISHRLASSQSSYVINTCHPSFKVTFQIATYNRTCVDTNFERQIQACLSDCSWLLLIVIANETSEGNYLR